MNKLRVRFIKLVYLCSIIYIYIYNISLNTINLAILTFMNKVHAQFMNKFIY